MSVRSLSSKEGAQLERFEDFSLKSKPISGLDCLTCAIFARQRSSSLSAAAYFSSKRYRANLTHRRQSGTACNPCFQVRVLDDASEPSLDALRLRSDVVSSIKSLSLDVVSSSLLHLGVRAKRNGADSYRVNSEHFLKSKAGCRPWLQA